MRKQFLAKTVAMAVPARTAERAIRVLRGLQLIDDRFEFGRTGGTVLIPIVRKPSAQEACRIEEQCGGVKVEQPLLPEVVRKPRDLREAVCHEIPKELVSNLPRSFDTIGEIGVVELPGELDQFARVIGSGILRISSHLRMVLKESSDVSGTYRTRKYEVIGGSGVTETVHREFSNRFRLDVATVYFNPRLSHERMRVAKQVKEGERVIDMFAGVGPYSILIAKAQPRSKIYAIDINPEAFKYLSENILLNDVADRIVPILGDAREIVARRLRNVVNRVIMNLPSESKDFVESALEALDGRGGIIHYYTFASRNETTDAVAETIREDVEEHGRKVESILFASILKEVAPNKVQIAVDLLIK